MADWRSLQFCQTIPPSGFAVRILRRVPFFAGFAVGTTGAGGCGGSPRGRNRGRGRVLSLISVGECGAHQSRAFAISVMVG